MELLEPEAGLRYPPYLRLVWSNPLPPRRSARVDLAMAIERHLAGSDGLSEEEFLVLYSGRRHRGPRPAVF